MERIRTLALFAATVCACAAAALMCTAGAALATPTPIALDGPQNGDNPLVAYDQVSKATFIAWSDNQAPDNGVELCVLQADTTACEGGGPVLLSVSSTENPALTGDNTVGLGGLTVLPNGDVVVIGTPVSNSSVAWESPGDGSAFLTSGQGLQNGGSFISPVSLFYTFGNAVALSNTDVGLLDDYGDYFSDSPFAGPESPAIPASNSNQGNGGMYPRQAQDIDGPEIAAEPAPSPAPANTDVVVGVGDNYAGPNTAPTGCVNSEATGYGVSVGTVNGGSNASGTLNGEGLPGYGLLTCSAENPVVASPEGGTQGIGVLENEGTGISGVADGTYTLDYRPFAINATATGGSFGAAALVAKLTGTADDIDVVDDSTDGVYAMWSEDGLHVNYSADGGAVWGPPVLLPDPTNGSFGDPVITALGGGTFDVAYTNNPGSGEEDFLEAFSYQELEQAPTTLGTIQSSGTTHGASISISAGTIGESDTAVISGANAAAATGTVDFALYDNSSCTGTPDFAGAASASGPTASIADDSTPGLAPGTYYWKAAYAGNTFNGASASTCGSEVLTVTSAATIPATATATTTSVTLTVTCETTPCTVTVTITIPATSTDFATAGKKAPKLITIAKGTFKLSKKGKHSLKLKWNTAGKRLIKKDSKLRTTLDLSTKTAHGTYKSTHALKITKRK
jgi:hypothetical protein